MNSIPLINPAFRLGVLIALLVPLSWAGTLLAGEKAVFSWHAGDAVAQAPAAAFGGEHPATLFLATTLPDGFPSGTLVSQISGAGKFAVCAWPMPFLERQHLAFHWIIPARKAPRAVSADLDRLPPTQSYRIVVRRQAEGRLELWVNGELLDARPDLPRSVGLAGSHLLLSQITANAGLRVGALPDGSDPAAGKIESVSLWSRALPDAELAALFGRPLGRALCQSALASALEPGERELAVGRFGPLTARTDIEPRCRALDEKIPAYRAALLADDGNDFPRFHLVIPGEQYNPTACYHEGCYHLFQTWSAGGIFNYFNDRADGLHLQHLSSKDLIHWTFHPKPLRSLCQNENGCFFTAPDGAVVFLFYGSGTVAEWPCLPRMECTDPLLERWTLFRDKGRVLGGPPAYACRHDPSGVFQLHGTWYMHATIRPRGAGNKGATIPLYSSPDAVDWTYVGPFYHHPEGEPSGECGQTATLSDGKVVYFFGHDLGPTPATEKVGYVVGRLDDAGRLQQTALGRMDKAHFTATATDATTGRVLTWWMQHDLRPFDQTSRAGWKSCLTLPTAITIGAGGTLRYQPAPELAALRTRHHQQHIPATARAEPIGQGLDLRQTEIIARFKPAAQGIHGIRLTDGTQTLVAAYDAATQEFLLGTQPRSAVRVKAARDTAGEVQLRLFTDRSVFELFGDSDAKLSVFRTFPDLRHLRAEWFATHATTATVDIWQMDAIRWQASTPGKTASPR